MQTRFTMRCIQSGEKCSFISLLAPYPFNKYKCLIKILSSSVKIILFIYMTTVVCQGAWLPWKPYSWYSTRTKLFELNQSETEWRCLVWKIIMGELILMNLCRPALGVQFFLIHSVHCFSKETWFFIIIRLLSKFYHWHIFKEILYVPITNILHFMCVTALPCRIWVFGISTRLSCMQSK